MKPRNITPLSNCICKYNANEYAYVNVIESSLRVQTWHGPVKVPPLFDYKDKASNRETIKAITIALIQHQKAQNITHLISYKCSTYRQ